MQLTVCEGLFTLKYCTDVNSWGLILIWDLEHKIWLGNWSCIKVNIHKSISSTYTNSFQLEDIKEAKTPFKITVFKSTCAET